MWSLVYYFNLFDFGLGKKKILLTFGVCVYVLVTQLCLTLCNPMDCSPLGSSVHGILQARILGWVAMPYSRGSSPPSDQTCISSIVGRFFTHWTTWESWRKPEGETKGKSFEHINEPEQISSGTLNDITENHIYP